MFLINLSCCLMYKLELAHLKCPQGHPIMFAQFCSCTLHLPLTRAYRSNCFQVPQSCPLQGKHPSQFAEDHSLPEVRDRNHHCILFKEPYQERKKGRGGQRRGRKGWLGREGNGGLINTLALKFHPKIHNGINQCQIKVVGVKTRQAENKLIFQVLKNKSSHSHIPFQTENYSEYSRVNSMNINMNINISRVPFVIFSFIGIVEKLILSRRITTKYS